VNDSGESRRHVRLPDQIQFKTQFILHSLRSRKFRFSSEADLQDGIELALKVDDIPYEREYRMGPLGEDRIDFLVAGDIGLEVKFQGSPIEVARQLLRYAAFPAIGALVLATGKLRLGRLPEVLLGKPISVLGLWKGFL